MKRASALALALFRFLDERDVAYCVVGDSRGFPDEIPSDLDIVVEQRALPGLACTMLEFCSEQEVSLVQCLRHEQNARYFVLAWMDEGGRPHYLVPDICGDYYRRGTLLLTATELLAGRVAAADECGEPLGFQVPAPALEFIYYLLKRIDKRSLNERHGSHLSSQWRLDPDGAFEQLQRFWDPAREARVLARAAAADDWHAVQQALPWLRIAMRKRLRFSARAWLGEMLRQAARTLQPSGLLVSVLGADGSGKSALIAQMTPAVAPAFRRSRVMHLRPRLGRRTAAAPVADPYGAAPRGPLASAAKLGYFVLDYGIGYLAKVRPLLVRSTLVVFDRYYHDLLADPRRYRYGAPISLARWMGRLIPQPDLWLVLDAPAPVLQARKQEVAPLESVRQREAYLRFAQTRDDAVVLDAGQPLENVAAEAAAAILECLAQRTRQRLEPSSAGKHNPAGARLLLFFCRHPVPLLSRMVRILFNSDVYCRLHRSVCLPHPYGIVIHSKALVGRRVTIMQQVTIGAKDYGENLAPVIGNDVYIGAGARVLGGIRVGNGAVIGANAVVTRDIPPYATVVGINRILEHPAAAAGDLADEPGAAAPLGQVVPLEPVGGRDSHAA